MEEEKVGVLLPAFQGDSCQTGGPSSPLLPPVAPPLLVPEGGGGVKGLRGGGVGGPLSSSIGYRIVLSESSSLDMAIKRIVEQYT